MNPNTKALVKQFHILGRSNQEIANSLSLSLDDVGSVTNDMPPPSKDDPSESLTDRLRRMEVTRQLFMLPHYAAMELSLIQKLTESIDTADTESLCKISKAYKDLRATGLPQNFIDQIDAAKGITVQILNQA
jgi:hypothetical protein